MRFAVNRKEGGVAIITLAPIAVLKEGEFYNIVKMKDETLFCEPLNKKLDAMTVSIVGLSDLFPDTIPGIKIVFPNVFDELKKHVDVEYDLTSTSLIMLADLPADRTYRDAWHNTGEQIVHDMSRARAIHRDILRRSRAPLLALLDVDYARADEAGSDALKKSIAKRKQMLRDITAHPSIDAAQTVDDLKKVTING